MACVRSHCYRLLVPPPYNRRNDNVTAPPVDCHCVGVEQGTEVLDQLVPRWLLDVGEYVGPHLALVVEYNEGASGEALGVEWRVVAKEEEGEVATLPLEALEASQGAVQSTAEGGGGGWRQAHMV